MHIGKTFLFQKVRGNWHPLVCIWWLTCLSSTSLYAQKLSEEAKISLLTYEPSSALYAAFGHSALRIQDPTTEYDMVFNYGMFSFDEGNFYLKFARGKLNYWLGTYDFSHVAQESAVRNTVIYEQQLRLTSVEKQVMFDRLTKNLRPENRYYQYDFFYDNCVTRIRDITRDALGNQLQLDTSFVRDYSFRDLIDLYMAPQPWGDLGIDLALGARIDQRAPAIDYLFLPEYAAVSFANSTVERAKEIVPLTSEQVVLFEKRTDSSVSPSYWRPQWVFSGVLGLSILLTFLRRHKQPWYWSDAILFIIYGLMGVVILLLWVATDHTATKDNYNLLWLHPLHLASAWLLVQKKEGIKVRFYWLISGGYYLLFLILWKVFPQEFHPAFIPLVVLLAFRCFYLYTNTGKYVSKISLDYFVS